jgi:phosphoglycolate phosphatase
MVGDSALDLHSAQAAGCPAVLVEWGYGHHALPPGMNPARVADPAQLLQALLAARASSEPITHS